MKISEFLQDGDHEFSATRLAFLAWLLGALIVWMAGSIGGLVKGGWKPGEPVKIGAEVVTILGILMTGKVSQSVAENVGDKKDQKTTPAGAASNPRSSFSGSAKTDDGKVIVITNGVVSSVT